MSELSEKCVELPVINVYDELSESVLSSLSAACNEWGFFYIKNHGFSKEFYHKLISIADQLFRLPQATKNKLPISSYIPMFMASPFFESFKFSGPDFSASAHCFTESLLGHHNTEFSNLLEEYGSKMKNLSKRIVELLLNILGDNFANKFYDSEFSNCRGNLGINNYSPRDSDKEDDEVEEIEGLGKHTDISCVTILFQDNVGGLQMRSKGGEWMDIRPCEDALVVNIGDFMQAWSNERLRSAEHRVVLRQNVKRFSMAFFWSYVNEREIYAPMEVVGEGNMRLYRPFSTKEYKMFRVTTARGNYEKVGATVKDFAGIIG